jgi:hypothetical protein
MIDLVGNRRGDSRHVYLKLGIHSRTELADALATQSAARAQSSPVAPSVGGARDAARTYTPPPDASQRQGLQSGGFRTP